MGDVTIFMNPAEYDRFAAFFTSREWKKTYSPTEWLAREFVMSDGSRVALVITEDPTAAPKVQGKIEAVRT